MFSGLPQIADIPSRSRGRLRIQPAGQYRPNALDPGQLTHRRDDRRDDMVVQTLAHGLYSGAKVRAFMGQFPSLRLAPGA